MYRLSALPLLLTALAVPVVATAESLAFQPARANKENLDHHAIYMWRIDGANQIGALTVGNSNHVVTGLPLYFDDRGSWETTANRLFTHLVDEATPNGNDLRAKNGASNGTGEYTYHFAEAQIVSLVDYILSGNDFAQALDPGSHFDDDSSKRSNESGAPRQTVPEPASMWLLGAGLAGLIARARRTGPPSRKATARQAAG